MESIVFPERARARGRSRAPRRRRGSPAEAEAARTRGRPRAPGRCHSPCHLQHTAEPRGRSRGSRGSSAKGGRGRGRRECLLRAGAQGTWRAGPAWRASCALARVRCGRGERRGSTVGGGSARRRWQGGRAARTQWTCRRNWLGRCSQQARAAAPMQRRAAPTSRRMTMRESRVRASVRFSRASRDDEGRVRKQRRSSRSLARSLSLSLACLLARARARGFVW